MIKEKAKQKQKEAGERYERGLQNNEQLSQNSAKAIDTREAIATQAGVSHDTVHKVKKIIHVTNAFGEINKVANFANFEQSALYLLAAPSTPEPAREEAIELAEDGEKISHGKAKEINKRSSTNEF